MGPSQIAKNIISQIEDKILALDVRAALSRSLNVRYASFIDVSVKKGIVTLSGHLPDDENRKAANITASTVKGVVGVVDRVSLLPSEHRQRVPQASAAM